MSLFDFASENAVSIADYAPDAGVMVPELPPANQYYEMFGSTAQPLISDIPRSDGISVTGVLGQVKAGADSLIGVWKDLNVIQNNAAAAKYQSQIDTARLNLDAAKTLSTLDVEKTKALAADSIAKNQAQLAVANDLAKSKVTAGFSLTTGLLIFGAILLLSGKGKIA